MSRVDGSTWSRSRSGTRRTTSSRELPRPGADLGLRLDAAAVLGGTGWEAVRLEVVAEQVHVKDVDDLEPVSMA